MSMRMWMLPPEMMCRKHLLGEHVEMHMLVGTIRKGISTQGYIDNGLVELDRIQERHDALVKEMESRGYNHKSPLPEIPQIEGDFGTVDREESLREICRRCDDCRLRSTTRGSWA